MPEERWLAAEGDVEATMSDAWMLPALSRRTAQVAGYRMSYVTGGQGSPVLLLHGLGAGNFIWRRTLPTLAAQYAVYAPDMLGCHLSDKPVIDYSVGAMAGYVREFLDIVGIRRAHVIAHSMGGPVALTLRYLFPEVVDRLVLVASGGLGRAVHWFLRVGSIPGATRIAAALGDPRSRLHRLGLRMERAVMRRWRVVDDDLSPTLLARWHEREQRLIFARMARAIANLGGQTTNLLPLLPHLVGTPTLIIWGAHDPIIPLAHGQRAARLIAGAQIEIFAECFHDPQLEASDAFNALVLRFLAGGSDAMPLAASESSPSAAMVWPAGRHARRWNNSRWPSDR